jgi:trimeric autotransporter adhesin
MKPNRIIDFALMLWLASAIAAAAQGAAFTYQGRLTDGSSPAQGLYDLQFTVYDSESEGRAVGRTITLRGTPVSNGLFTVTLEFSDTPFTGGDRWLEIAVSAEHAFEFNTLRPRQKLTAVPYAMTAGTVSGLVPSQSIAGTYGGAVTFNNSGNAFSGNGSGLTGVDALTLGGLGVSSFWNTIGNAGTTAGANFVGTTDNQPLEFRVNGARALRIEPYGGAAPSLIGGYHQNTASFGGAVIAGGGTSGSRNEVQGAYGFVGAGHGGKAGPLSAVVGGAYNNSLGEFSFIGTGVGNTNFGGASVIAGGSNNFIAAASANAFVGGGEANRAEADYATVGGGLLNTSSALHATVSGGQGNLAAGGDSSIGGGQQNTIETRTVTATIAGGRLNRVLETNFSVTIAGGEKNVIESNASFSTVGGGILNTIAAESASIAGGFQNRATGHWSTIPGGRDNAANGQDSFAAGRGAKANHAGAFVWADSTDADFASTANDQFNIRAGGGVRFHTDTSLSFGAQRRQMLNLYGTSYAIGVQDSSLYFRCNNANANDGFIWYRGGAHANGYADAGGGTELMHLVAGGLYVNGALVPMSDRNVKTNFASLNIREVLEKVLALPLSRWSYTNDVKTMHVGPMAQDFCAAFGLGADEKHIATVDADGVALAAIQGLNQKLQEELKEKDAKIAALEQRLGRVEELLTANGL